jgi:hypothetical protein
MQNEWLIKGLEKYALKTKKGKRKWLALNKGTHK